MAEKKVKSIGVSAIRAVPLVTKVVRKGEPVPDIDDLPVANLPAYKAVINKDVDTHQTIADRLDLMCESLGGARHYRKVDDNTGEVSLSVKTTDETVLTGKGASTAEAFNKLLEKVQRFMGSGLNKPEAK